MMDWNYAIKAQGEALLRIVASLFAMAGVAGSETRLPRDTRFAILRILRPAESAARRLIIIFLNTMKVQADASSARSVAPSKSELPNKKITKKTRLGHVPAFKLYDTPKRFDYLNKRQITQNPPRIRVGGFTANIYEPPRRPQLLPTEHAENAASIIGRLKALQNALGAC